MIKRVHRVARLAMVGLLAALPAEGVQLAGQLVLQTESAGQIVEGDFIVPHKRVQLRILPYAETEASILINNKVVFDGLLSPQSRDALVLTDEDAVKQGSNHLAVYLRRGDIAVSVDFPTLNTHDESAGLTPEQHRSLTQLLQRYIGTDPEKDRFPGAALLVAREGQVVYAEGQGMALYHLQHGKQDNTLTAPVKVSADTVFDLASVTKVVATTSAIMHLVSTGKLSLDDTLGALIPSLASTDKSSITLQQLLTHRSGLWEWQPTWLHKKRSRASIYSYLAALPRRYDIEEKRAYSDLGFMLLGEVIEQVTGMPLDRYLQQTVFQPLGMQSTTYLPPESWRQNTAATSAGNRFEQHMVESGQPYPIVTEPSFTDSFKGYRDYTLVGEVNDGNAWYGLEGIAGHAGLFSTVRDLAIFCQMMLNGGGYGNVMIADPETTGHFLTTPYDTNQAFGFWRYEDSEGRESFGHPGFTGTQIWFRPADQLMVILLTNRQHNGLPASGQYPSIAPAWEAILSQVEAFWPAHNNNADQ